jgi:hypothetical protein
MSELGSISETWIDIQDALLIVVHWVDPHMSVGAANVFLKGALKSEMVRSGKRVVSDSEERRAGDIGYVTTVAPGRYDFAPFRVVVVKEDLEYYCALELGSQRTDGVATLPSTSRKQREQTSVVEEALRFLGFDKQTRDFGFIAERLLKQHKKLPESVGRKLQNYYDRGDEGRKALEKQVNRILSKKKQPGDQP